MLISGAQRLPNGNTLICSGINGSLFEVTPDRATVWKYVNPSKGRPGPGGFDAPPQPGQVLPSFLQDMLRMSAEQKKELGELQKEIDGRLDKLLTAEQKKQFKEPRPLFGPGAGPPPQAGQIMSASLQDTLKLSAEQRKRVQELQKRADETLAQVLTDEQKKQLKEVRQGFGRGGPGGPPGFPGLAGKDLTPGKTVEELESKETKRK